MSKIADLNDEYERVTGEPALLYVSQPTASTRRYVFHDQIITNAQVAEYYLRALVAEAKLAKCENTAKA
jgi:hypothetical protein